MKYLSLNNEEFKELLNLRKGAFSIHFLFFAFIVMSSYVIADKFIPNDIGSVEISPLTISLVVALIYSWLVIINNKNYIKDLLIKKKKIFRGILSSKNAIVKNREEKYQFNMDGNIFLVDKDTFERFQEGDLVEFHTSPLSKYLFKVVLAESN